MFSSLKFAWHHKDIKSSTNSPRSNNVENTKVLRNDVPDKIFINPTERSVIYTPIVQYSGHISAIPFKLIGIINNFPLN